MDRDKNNIDMDLVLDDFVAALYDLGGTLEYIPVKKDFLTYAVIEDAQIHCFQRTVIAFKAYLLALFDEEDKLAFYKDNELLFNYMAYLSAKDIISEDQLGRFGYLFEADELFYSLPGYLNSEEQEYYKTKAKAIRDYYHLLYEFLKAVAEGHDDEN